VAKAVYFKGVRLWENLRYWTGAAQRTGEMTFQGVKQTNVSLNPESPNFNREITVHTTIAPVTAVDDLSVQATVHAALLQEEKRLLAVADSLGDLAWVEDTDQKASVSGAETAGAGVQVEHGATGGSWTTEAGHYVLVRQPSTGLGFVSIINSRAAGYVNIDLDVDIDATWDIVNIAMHFPDVAYQRMDPGAPNQVGDDKWRADVVYLFQSATDPVFASDYNIDLDET